MIAPILRLRSVEEQLRFASLTESSLRLAENGMERLVWLRRNVTDVKDGLEKIGEEAEKKGGESLKSLLENEFLKQGPDSIGKKIGTLI